MEVGTDRMRIAIVGLGLIGGSFAHALRGFRSCARAGFDIDGGTAAAALAAGAIDEKARCVEDAVRGADIALFCTTSDAALKNARRCADAGVFKSGAVAVEICGVKRGIAGAMPQALPDGVRYVGLHPMAGKEVGGFRNATPELFWGAGFIIIEPDVGASGSGDAAGSSGNGCDGGASSGSGDATGSSGNGCGSRDWDASDAASFRDAASLVEEMCRHVGARRICRNSAADHDRIIAYTSGLMHVAASALCGRLPAGMSMAHAGGAFRDCTRVADIDADLWTGLLAQNADCILPHLDTYIGQLTSFRDALARGDGAAVHRLLAAGRDNKARMRAQTDGGMA